MNLILFGFKSSGKSYYGKLLASHLNCPFIDTDQLIEQEFNEQTGLGFSCYMINKTYGNDYFRSLEKKIIQQLSPAQNSIISLGGGTILSRRSQNILKKMGLLIFLDTPKKILFTRLLKAKNFPSFLDSDNRETSFLEHFEQRYPLYNSLFDYKIDISTKSDAMVLQELKDLYFKGTKFNVI